MELAGIPTEVIDVENRGRIEALNDEYDSLGRALHRRGCAIDTIKDKVKTLAVAIPTWGVGTGGTRFARFPIPGEPTNIFEKIEDCAIIQTLGRNTPTVSPHLPWDETPNPTELRDFAAGHGLGFDAVNSNTFQDRAGQARSYKYGSLTPRRCGGSRSGNRTQYFVHRDRKETRLEGDHGMDRGRREFPGAVRHGGRTRSLSRQRGRYLCRFALRLAAFHRAQAL